MSKTKLKPQDEFYLANMNLRPDQSDPNYGGPELFGPFPTEVEAKQYISKDILKYDSELDPQLFYILKKVAGYKAQPISVLTPHITETNEVAEVLIP